MSRVELRELLDAHERLGGGLPAELQEEVDGWLDVWNARVSPARARSGKVGRNAPCPCGSGKKYEKCCIDASAEQLRVQLWDAVISSTCEEEVDDPRYAQPKGVALRSAP
jgi:SEC-C motif-containing protein